MGHYFNIAFSNIRNFHLKLYFKIFYVVKLFSVLFTYGVNYFLYLYMKNFLMNKKYCHKTVFFTKTRPLLYNEY